MKLIFEGFDRRILINKGEVAKFVIENHVLFSRIIQSLISQLGERSIEPYMIFDEQDKRLKSKDSIMVISSPFNLPWNERSVVSKIYEKISEEISCNEEQRLEIEELGNSIRKQVFKTSLNLNSDYSFTIDWELTKFLKAFGYQIDFEPEDKLIDNLIKFIALISDIDIKKLLVFVNLEEFLDEKEFVLFEEQVKFYGVRVLLLETKNSNKNFSYSEYYVIDQQFLEY